MNRHWIRLLCGVGLVACGAAWSQTDWGTALSLLPVTLRAQDLSADREAVVLDTSGFWRFYLTLRTPLVRDGQTLEEIGAACNTLGPAQGWTGAEFDDAGWVRRAGAPLASWSHWEPAAQANVGFIYCHGSSPALAQLCLRGKFHVDNPAAAEGLRLSVKYRGGAAVYVNGRELARQHLPSTGALTPETPAEIYPRAAYYLEDGQLPRGYGGRGASSPRLQLRLRSLEIEIPSQMLRKGTNTLAIALHRAPLPKDVYQKLKALKDELRYYLWDACGLHSVRLPGVPWASHAHSYRDKLHGVPVAYTSAVWAPRFISWDGTSRQGWKDSRLRVQFARDVSAFHPLTVFRLIGEHNIGGDQRGFGRFGADFWPVLKDRHGERTGQVFDRYPRASWRNLNIKVALLGAGPDGPVATARFEVLREGLQECEARLFLEQALEDGTLPPDWAGHCRQLIAERNRAIVMGLSPHKAEGFLDASSYQRVHDWQDWGLVGYDWYLTSGWQERSGKLYDTAAAVAAKALSENKLPELCGTP